MLDDGGHVQPSTVGGGSFSMNAPWNGGGRAVAAEVLWKASSRPQNRDWGLKAAIRASWFWSLVS